MSIIAHCDKCGHHAPIDNHTAKLNKTSESTLVVIWACPRCREKHVSLLKQKSGSTAATDTQPR